MTAQPADPQRIEVDALGSDDEESEAWFRSADATLPKPERCPFCGGECGHGSLGYPGHIYHHHIGADGLLHEWATKSPDFEVGSVTIGFGKPPEPHDDEPPTDEEAIAGVLAILSGAVRTWMADSTAAQATRMLDEIADVVGFGESPD